MNVDERTVEAALSVGAREVLRELRTWAESDSGDGWWGVYLPNAGEGHSFAGYLGVLTVAGYYRASGDDVFGDVYVGESAAEAI